MPPLFEGFLNLVVSCEEATCMQEVVKLNSLSCVSLQKTKKLEEVAFEIRCGWQTGRARF